MGALLLCVNYADGEQTQTAALRWDEQSSARRGSPAFFHLKQRTAGAPISSSTPTCHTQVAL